MTAKKILIVDDDKRNIFALNAVLKTKGMFCVTAETAKDGIEILKTDDEIGVVLMDMMMPDMDGYQALAIIRSNQKLNAIPVIAVTAQAMDGDREHCLEAGASAYISKPINVDELMKVLNSY